MKTNTEPKLITPKMERPPQGLRDLIVWPERSLAPEGFPTLDALFLTHEHEGNFDPYTLSLLRKDTPVWTAASVGVARGTPIPNGSSSTSSASSSPTFTRFDSPPASSSSTGAASPTSGCPGVHRALV